MIVRKIGMMGLFFGGVITLFSIVGAAFVPDRGDAGLMGLFFGAAAVVLLPIFYGALGFITTLIGASLYNAIAGWVGGVELEVQ
jgi:hypothetical protein